jgi:hypothetical protein
LTVTPRCSRHQSNTAVPTDSPALITARSFSAGAAPSGARIIIFSAVGNRKRW